MNVMNFLPINLINISGKLHHFTSSNNFPDWFKLYHKFHDVLHILNESTEINDHKLLLQKIIPNTTNYIFFLWPQWSFNLSTDKRSFLLLLLILCSLTDTETLKASKMSTETLPLVVWWLSNLYTLRFQDILLIIIYHDKWDDKSCLVHVTFLLYTVMAHLMAIYFCNWIVKNFYELQVNERKI